jgi:ankyrin repeat protein
VSVAAPNRLVEAADKNERRPLHIAAKHGHDLIAKLLIEASMLPHKLRGCKRAMHFRDAGGRE